MKKYISILMVLCSLTWIIAFAHPGRTDSNGGHWVRTEGWGYEVGTYHYHNKGAQKEESYTPPAKSEPPKKSSSQKSYSSSSFVGSEDKSDEKDNSETTYNYLESRKIYEDNQKEKAKQDKSKKENSFLGIIVPLVFLFPYIILIISFKNHSK
ncbi:MAG: YHYH domain-containing protein [Clostridia bacterium]|nr:YHYH domain-containing protein [Clostridia bacterium]